MIIKIIVICSRIELKLSKRVFRDRRKGDDSWKKCRLKISRKEISNLCEIVSKIRVVNETLSLIKLKRERES